MSFLGAKIKKNPKNSINSEFCGFGDLMMSMLRSTSRKKFNNVQIIQSQNPQNFNFSDFIDLHKVAISKTSNLA